VNARLGAWCASVLAPSDEEIAHERLRVSADVVYVRRVREMRARRRDLYGAIADLEVAHDRARWARWRLLLAIARAERAMRLAARVRGLPPMI